MFTGWKEHLVTIDRFSWADLWASCSWQSQANGKDNNQPFLADHQCFNCILSHEFLYAMETCQTFFFSKCGNQNILDLILTNQIEIIQDLEVVDGLSRSDHDAISFTVESNRPRYTPSKRLMYKYKSADFDAYRNLLTSALNVLWITFAMLFSTTGCVVRHENNQRWTVGCYNSL